MKFYYPVGTGSQGRIKMETSGSIRAYQGRKQLKHGEPRTLMGENLRGPKQLLKTRFADVNNNRADLQWCRDSHVNEAPGNV